MAFSVKVDTSKCNGCEECVNTCPVQVFEMAGGKSSPANASECVGCQSCINVCPTEAIEVSEA
jgi:NAD-dependent dihydropyrimidine dehydrogenase PreA subunit